ncbi:hypothetical protein [Leptospira kanakyensis]|uniref:Lipoprotein n=1 Tax=Leptospira kanakyensis TaxID=2484968 RepID=A0A6N4QFF5_9LEPT|nr:hypothetical protein [Leptospira kanakyensis]TGK76985.1 hypothetical protein EHQ18_00035 [Leptospira kanakyensis]
MKIIILVTFLTFSTSCSTIDYEKNSKLIKYTKSSILSVHIGYEYYLNGKLMDHPLQFSDGVIDIEKDYKLIIQKIKDGNQFSNVKIDFPAAEYELELNIIFKNESNLALAFISGVTFTLFPSIIDSDLEIQGILYNRRLGIKSKKIIASGKMRTYFGILQLIYMPFSNSSKNRELLISNLLNQIMNDTEL